MRWAGIGLIAAIELVLLFKASSLTRLNSDHVWAALEISDVLQGNVFLHGWILAQQNYYLTDMPFFLLGRVVLGHSLVALYAPPFLIYLLLLAVALTIVWQSRASARDRLIGAAAVLFFLGTPDHAGIGALIFVGTQHVATLGYCLIAWLALTRIAAPSPNWRPLALFFYVAATVVVFFSDPLSIFVFLMPTLIGLLIALVGAQERRTCGRLIVVTIVAFIGARLALLAVRGFDGFVTIFPEPVQFVKASQFGGNLAAAFFGLLQLSGADLFGKPLIALDTVMQPLRLVGLAFMVAATAASLRRGFSVRSGWDLRFVLAAAMTIQLVSCLTSQDFAEALHSAAPFRFLAPVLLFGGVLTSLEMPELLWATRHTAWRTLILSVAGVGAVAAALTFAVDGARHWSQPPIMTRSREWSAGQWLLDRGMSNGVGAYWQAALVTALTAEKAAIRAVFAKDGRLLPYTWVAKADWYTERPQFVIYDRHNEFCIAPDTIAATYGAPTAIEHVAGYDIAVLAANGQDKPVAPAPHD